ncbi:hypothetical protein CsSME_00029566 [Camellia sinensis var. sinensis]
MELNLSTLYYSYRRPRHGGSASILLPGSGGSFMELVIRRVTRLRGTCLESVLSANLCVSRGGSGYRPSVIPGLLTGYDAKAIGAGLVCDTLFLFNYLIPI